MKIPTITQFNAWPISDQEKWIFSETHPENRHSQHPGMLAYPKEKILIHFIFNHQKRVLWAKAYTLKEGLREWNNLTPAMQAVTSIN